MKYFYCDSCFLITFYQDGNLSRLSQYKEYFHISETQLKDELIKPDDLPDMVRKSVKVIKDRDEIKNKTNEFMALYSNLSRYDCLCMAFAILDGYCLVTDDTALIKKCNKNHIKTKTSNDILRDFEIGGDLYVNDVKKK